LNNCEIKWRCMPLCCATPASCKSAPMRVVPGDIVLLNAGSRAFATWFYRRRRLPGTHGAARS
jgi:hypothetical protein